MRERLGEHFYIVNFQDSTDADHRFAEDVPHFFDIMMRRGQITRAAYEQLPKDRKVLSLLAAMGREKSGGEPLLSPDERAVYVQAFERGGFTAPINWYRNWSHNWRSYRHLPQKIDVPTLFIGAVDDVIVSPEQIAAMKPRVADLEIRMIDRCGHWTQQEQPDQVNAMMIDWLSRRL
jgi:pimeloyl-ACP methyl ester carboxylesterase